MERSTGERVSNLTGAGSKKRRLCLHSNTVTGIETEDEWNHGDTNSFRSTSSKASRQSSDQDKTDKHDSARQQEERASSKTLNAQGTSACSDQTPDLEAAIDQSLVSDAGDADCAEDCGEVVADHSVTDPLAVNGEGESNEESSTVSLGGDKGHVRGRLGGLFLRFDGCNDFVEFEVDERMVHIAALSEGLESQRVSTPVGS